MALSFTPIGGRASLQHDGWTGGPRRFMDRRRDDGRRRALVAGTAGVSGADFFHSLVKHLAAAAGARSAFVCELVEAGEPRARALSVWSEDRYVEPFDCRVAQTPLADVIECGLCWYADGVSRRFPEPTALSTLGEVSFAGLPLHDSAGRLLGVLGVCHDERLEPDDDLVSAVRVFAARAGVEIERIRAERHIRQLNQDLERRVAERTAELQALNHELEAFSYSVSHDLHAPVRQIAGFAELVLRDPGLSSQSARHLTDISDAASRMSALITALLEFSRAGRVACREAAVDLSALASEAIAEVVHGADGRRIEWVLGDLPYVRGDRTLLRQVFVNLLSNAVKYTGPKAVARIEIGTVPPGDADDIVAYVRDNGVGFDARQAHKLFGVFQRLHPPASFEGTGIGLASVQRIIHRHGGRVWATGEVDGGATFFVALPRDRATRPSPASREVGEPRS